MTIEEALRAKLVEVLGHTRVYPDGGVPQNQNTWPVVTYDHQGDDDRVSLSGTRSRVRIDEFELAATAPTRLECAAARDAIKAAFCGFNARGVWGGAGGVFVPGAVAKDAAGEADDPFDGGEELTRTERLTLRINWRAP